jgi:hypothetical protein
METYRQLDEATFELGELMAAARLGHGAMAVVSGRAGIGKTALLAELTASASAAGTATLSGRAVVDEGAPQFWPWFRVLEEGRGLGEQDRASHLPHISPVGFRSAAVPR